MAESLTGKCIADVIAAVLRYHGVDRVDQAERAWRERAARPSLEG